MLKFAKTLFLGLATDAVAKEKSTEKKSKGYWLDIDNRRKFFLKFAEEKGFDPLVPENWYTITKRQVSAKKVILLFPILCYSLLKLAILFLREERRFCIILIRA